jgi:hypothetical protein
MLTRVLPKPGFARDDATQFGVEHGWRYHDIFLADEEQPFEKIWLTEDGSTSIHWIEDHVLDLDYFAVQGDRRDDVVQAIRDDIETYDHAQLRELMESAEDWDDVLAALHHVAAAAPPQFDPELFEWFERGFTHEHPAVRKMTAILTSYPGWSQFREPLERLLDDEDAEVRDVAATMLGKLAAGGGDEAQGT